MTPSTTSMHEGRISKRKLLAKFLSPPVVFKFNVDGAAKCGVLYDGKGESLVAFQCPIHVTPMKHRFGPLGRLCGLLGDHYCDFLSHMILESDSSNAISWCEETWMCHLDTTFF